MSVLCFNWETAHLHGETWIAHHRLRHRLFVERQGWDVPTVRGLEHDQFDTPAAQYLVWKDNGGDVRGVARLLPTSSPYMVKNLWPDLVDGELPESAGVWETTRFGCDRSLGSSDRRRVVSEMLCAMQEFAMANGIRQYLVVMPVRLLQCVVVKAGCEVSILGSSRMIGRFPTVAAYLTVSQNVLAELRRRAGIGAPVLANDVSIAA